MPVEVAAGPLAATPRAAGAPVVLIQASPHAGGVTDTLADTFAAQFPPHVVQRLIVREHAIAPCRGCNACATPPHHCVLDSPAGTADAASQFFASMQQARLLVICAPIYFYGLPGQCKGFMDRGQRLWHERQASEPSESGACESRLCECGSRGAGAIALLAAGRPRGEQLFAGSLLTLKYFLALFDVSLVDNRCLYGLDNRDALAARPDVLDDIRALGQHWAGTVCA